MAKKAVLRFDPFEYRYQEEYGIMPDRDMDRLLESTGSEEEAYRIWNERAHALWQKMKYEHDHAEEMLQRELAKECPF